MVTNNRAHSPFLLSHPPWYLVWFAEDSCFEMSENYIPNHVKKKFFLAILGKGKAISF